MSLRSTDPHSRLACDTLSFEIAPHARQERAPIPYLVMVFQCGSPHETPFRVNLRDLRRVTIGRARQPSSSVVMDQNGEAHVAIPDVQVSGCHAQLTVCADGWTLRDSASKNGTIVNGKAVQEVHLRGNELIEIGGAMFLFTHGDPEDDERRAAIVRLDSDESIPALATLNPRLDSTYRELRQVARHDIPIVVCGQTGTGKELTARAIHQLSGRRGAFVAVNCGSLPDTLVESELFGAKRGAFFGATEDRVGLVRSADGGTLFLDEIAELPEQSQVSLLRVLQEGEVRRVGDTHTTPVDIRVVCATHQNLEDLVAEGRFRADLYARLFGFTVHLPPLRKRKEDLGALVSKLLRTVTCDGSGESIQFSRVAARALFGYEFPLNIRELEHILRTAIALCDGSVIDVHHFPHLREKPSVFTMNAADRSLRARLTSLLREHRGNVSAVAREFDKAPIQVRRWCKRFEIDIEDYRQ